MRDVYAVGGDHLLLVATDRVSAFDVVLNQGIPDKGRVLTQISVFWFAQTAGVLPNHLVTADDDAIAAAIAEVGVTITDELRAMLAGRCLLCKRTKPLPIEAVVRGYVSGSAWQEYKGAPVTDGHVDLWGVTIPAGLVESDQLPAPIFTPTTKAAAGHDEPMPQDEIHDYIGAWETPLIQAAIALYTTAAEYARGRGIIIADTKFEFGVNDSGELLLIDEALTPDSSRFWDVDAYEPGRGQASFDKQSIRDYLSVVPGWNKQPPAPDLPAEVVEQSAAKYRDAYRRLTGHEL